MKIKCPHCGIELDAPEDSYGRRVECTACGKKFIAGQVSQSVSQSCNADGELRIGWAARLWWAFKATVSAVMWFMWLSLVTFFSAEHTTSDCLLAFFVAVWFTKYCVLDDLKRFRNK